MPRRNGSETSGSVAFHTNPLRLFAALRRVSPAVLLAIVIGAGAVALNVLLARQLVEIEQDAHSIAESWIERSATLANFEDGVREFRRHEALFALSPDGPEHRSHTVMLDSLRASNDRTLAALIRLDGGAADSTGTESLRREWSRYRTLHFADRALPSGNDSPSLKRFRDREPLFQQMIAQARGAQVAMRAGARGVAMRSERTTQASQGLLIARTLMVLAVIVLVELLRRSWKERSEAEQRWRDVADQSVGVVWEVGPNGRIRFCSRSGFEVLGREANVVDGRHALRFIHANDRRCILSKLKAAAPTNAPIRDLEVRVVRSDGTLRWLAVSAQPLRTRDGRHDGFRGLAVDITRRTQAEQALAQSRRIEAVGTLAGGVAHDLNNVLAAVTGYAQLAQAELPATHPAQQDMAAITAAAERGAGLVRRVLQFARQRPTQRQPVEIAELVHEVTQLLRPQLPPTVRIRLDLPDAESLVLADPTELHQVVVNIAANAINAMRDSGTTLGFTVAATEHDVVLTIVDDGAGMSADVLDRAIEPFYTTRDVGEGTGMGLAVAHGVVTSLGGTLHIASTLGKGTTVTVTLPRAVSRTQPATEPAQSAPNERVSLRVIVVDDDPQVRNAIVRVLERAGHAVDAFAAAPAALDAVRVAPSRADVVLTDLTMPGMNGLEFTALLQAIHGAPPVVMSSGYLDLVTSEQARALGIVTLLDKPVDSGTLLKALHDAARVVRVA